MISCLKKNSHKYFCPGCILAAPTHDFGPLNKFCTGPRAEESEDSAEAIDTAGVSPTSAQCNPLKPTTELLQRVRSLSGQIGKIQLEQTALKDEINHLGKRSPESSRCNTQATMPTITLPSGNNTGSTGVYMYVDLITLLPPPATTTGNETKDKKPETIESFDHWLEAWSAHKKMLVLTNLARYVELA